MTFYKVGSEVAESKAEALKWLPATGAGAGDRLVCDVCLLSPAAAASPARLRSPAAIGLRSPPPPTDSDASRPSGRKKPASLLSPQTIRFLQLASIDWLLLLVACDSLRSLGGKGGRIRS